jgi:hypothetical protein
MVFCRKRYSRKLQQCRARKSIAIRYSTLGTQALTDFIKTNAKKPLLETEGGELLEWLKSFYDRKYESDDMFRQYCIIKSIKMTHQAKIVELVQKLELFRRNYEESASGIGLFFFLFFFSFFSFQRNNTHVYVQ